MPSLKLLVVAALTSVVMLVSCGEDINSDIEFDLVRNVNFKLRLVNSINGALPEAHLFVYDNYNDWLSKTNPISQYQANSLGEIEFNIQNFVLDTLWIRTSKRIPDGLQYFFTQDSIIVLEKPKNNFKGSVELDVEFYKNIHLKSVRPLSLSVESLTIEHYSAIFMDNKINDFTYSYGDRCTLAYPDTTGAEPDINIVLSKSKTNEREILYESIDQPSTDLPFKIVFENPKELFADDSFYLSVFDREYPNFNIIESAISRNSLCDISELQNLLASDNLRYSSNYNDPLLYAHLYFQIGYDNTLLSSGNFENNSGDLLISINDLYPSSFALTNYPYSPNTTRLASLGLKWNLIYE